MVRYPTTEPAAARPRHEGIGAERAAFLADMLRALAHPIRLRIVALLCDGDLHVAALSERLDVPQAIVSQQLRVLRGGGLVEARRANGLSVYTLLEPRLRDLVGCMESCPTSAGKRGRGAGR